MGNEAVNHCGGKLTHSAAKKMKGETRLQTDQGQLQVFAKESEFDGLEKIQYFQWAWMLQ